MAIIEKNQLLTIEELAHVRQLLDQGKLADYYAFLWHEKGFEYAHLAYGVVTDSQLMGQGANKYMGQVLGSLTEQQKLAIKTTMARNLYDVLVERNKNGTASEITWKEAENIHQGFATLNHPLKAWTMTLVAEVLEKVTFGGGEKIDINALWEKSLRAQNEPDGGLDFSREMTFAMDMVLNLPDIDESIKSKAREWLKNAVASNWSAGLKDIPGSAGDFLYSFAYLNAEIESQTQLKLVDSYLKQFNSYLKADTSVPPLDLTDKYYTKLGRFQLSGKLFDIAPFKKVIDFYRLANNDSIVTFDVNKLFSFLGKRIDGSTLTSGLKITATDANTVLLNQDSINTYYIKNGQSFTGTFTNDEMDFTGYQLAVKLDGGGGVDKLIGGDGNDVLIGGSGKDELIGGKGDDKYYADKDDVIKDADGKGRVFLDNNALYGGWQVEGQGNSSQFKDVFGRTYEISGTTLIIDGGLKIENFVDAGFTLKAGESYSRLGITLTCQKDKDKDKDERPKIDDGVDRTSIVGEDDPKKDNADKLYGEQAGVNYHLQGKLGDDTLIANAGDDILDGGEGDDYLEGGKGKDILIGGKGSNRLLAGEDDDLVYADKQVEADENYGADGNNSGRGSLLDGGEGNDTLVGSDKDDIIFSGAGDNLIYAGEGDDIILLQEKLLSTTKDWALVARNTDNKFTRSCDYQGIYTTLIDDASVTNIVYAGAGNDWIGTSSGFDIIYAGKGDDTVFGAENNDLIYGEEGDDLIYGDIFREDLGNQYGFHTSAKAGDVYGNDTLDGGAGDDWILGGGGDDVIYGGVGNDTLQGDHLITDLATADYGNDYLDGGGGRDALYGGRGDDTLMGGAGNDTLVGDYNDTNYSVHGHDYMDGGDDDDDMWGGGGNDTMLGGAGNDYIQGDAGNNFLYGGDGNDSLVASGESQNPADHGNNFLDGGAGDDILAGGLGSDTLLGGAGNDTLLGLNVRFDTTGMTDRDNDYLDGGDGDDLLVGLDGNNTLIGGIGNDTLVADLNANYKDIGVIANDLLYAGEGNDWLLSAGGEDTLYGGTGNDTYGLYLKDGNTVNIYEETDNTANNIDWVLINNVNFNDESTKITAGVIGLVIETALGTVILNNYKEFEYLQFADVALSIKDYVAYLQQPVNHAPIAVGELNKQQIDTGSELSWSIPQGSFVDIDLNDTLTYQATLADGSPLPSWLSFDSTAGSLKGNTPNDATLLTIVITATDKRGLSASQNFTLEIVQGIEKIKGTAGNDRLAGDAKDNYLMGLGGNDQITANAGNDTLDGGLGNDTLNGGLGADTYQFAKGDGQDTINTGDTNQAIDTIRFTDITTDDITSISRTGNNLIISYGDNDKIIVTNHFTTAPIGHIAFTDGHVFNFQDFLNQQWGGLTLTVSADNMTFNNGDNLIKAGLGNDRITTGAGNDSLYGEDGNDNLTAGAGDDLLVGGLGNDTLNGGLGADTYLFAKGDGQDTINTGDTNQAIDTISFTDITAEQITSIIRTGNNLIISYGDNDKITVTNHFTTAPIGHIAFADGHVFNFQDFLNQQWGGLTLTASADNMTFNNGDNLIKAGLGNDRITTGAGNDSLYGEDGNDNLTAGAGDDLLVGGLGNDTLNGGLGADTYQFAKGDGQDTINTGDTNQAIDTISFTDITAADINNISRVGNNLVIDYGNGDKITVTNHFTTAPIGNIAFADKQVINFQDFLNQQWGGLTLTASADNMTFNNGDNLIKAGLGNDRITTGEGNDTLYGEDGNDTLTGGAGDDLLVGGLGNDSLTGGTGNDTYLFGRGDGQDILNNTSATWQSDNDRLLFQEGINADQLWFQKTGNNLIVSIIGTTDKITVSNWYSSDQYKLDSFELANGNTLLANQVDSLVNAMASFKPPLSGQTELPDDYHNKLDTVIAVGWN